MTSVYLAREASRSLLLRCCTVNSPTSWHRKVVRCLTQIYSSLDRVNRFEGFLLNCTADTVDALNATLDFVSHLASDGEPSSLEEEQKLMEALSRLWELYMDLDDGLKLQEVTTPAPRHLPKLKCRTTQDQPLVKSPLARVSLTRFQSLESKVSEE